MVYTEDHVFSSDYYSPLRDLLLRSADVEVPCPRSEPPALPGVDGPTCPAHPLSPAPAWHVTPSSYLAPPTCIPASPACFVLGNSCVSLCWGWEPSAQPPSLQSELVGSLARPVADWFVTLGSWFPAHIRGLDLGGGEGAAW